LLVVVLAALYLRRLRRPSPPSVGRRWTFAIGLLLLAWTTCGFPEVYGDDLYWVWTTQTLVLWLGIPIVLLSGCPPPRLSDRRGFVDRLLERPAARFVANPLVGPALVPVLSGVLFFGPLAGWSIAYPRVGWLVQLLLIGIGALMVLPLVGFADRDATSLAVGLALGIGSFELVLDALPGVILRLHNSMATTWFDHRAAHPWSPHAISDQRVAGAILWCVAEVIDLPFLLLAFRRWMRADERDAATVDAVLEAERTARRALQPDADAPAVDRDAPWWLTDPAFRDRRPPGG
jgi:cytochrome c oxidase assembly factor CtaG